MSHQRMLDIDELRRNTEDGAYHCPRCDAPFTRRSNLRRHYAIHIRKMDSKYHSWKGTFGSSEQSQYHTIQSPGLGGIPNTSDPDASTSENQLPNNNIESGSSRGENFEASLDFFSLVSPSPSVPLQNETLNDFFSYLASTSAPSAGSPNLSSLQSFDTTSSSGLDTWSLIKPPLEKLSRYDIESSTPRQQRSGSHHDVGVGKRLKSKEKPIYTRREVEDLLEIANKIFAERMEEIIRHFDYSNRYLWTHIEGGTTPGAPSMHLYDFTYPPS